MHAATVRGAASIQIHVNMVCIILPVQLIIAVAGVLTGYNGSFEFKEPGQEYGEYPYVGMRVVSSYPFICVLP